MRWTKRQEHPALPRQFQHFAPFCRRGRQEVLPPGLYLRGRVDRKGPLPALPFIAGIGFADAPGPKRSSLVLAPGDIKRCKAAFCRDLADMWMVDDDQVICARQLLDRK